MTRYLPLLAALLLLIPATAFAETDDAEDPEPSEEVEEVEEVEQPEAVEDPEPPAAATGCTEVGAAEVGERAFRACEDGRVIVDGPDGRDVRMAPGRIDKLIIDDDQVWVVTTRREATDVDGLPSAIGVAVDLEAPPVVEREPDVDEVEEEPLETVGSALSEQYGVVVIDLGARQGLSEGDRVEFFDERAVELGDGERATETVSYAIARVSAVSENRAEVVLGLNERVPETATVRPTTRSATAETTSPPRLGGLTRVQLALRPFLALQTVGAGTVSQGLISHQFDAPFTIEAIFEPLAFGFARQANLVAITGIGLISYDTTLFQVGLGVGGTTVDTSSFGQRDLAEEDRLRVVGAFAISQKIRLGALDGLHIQAINSFFLAAQAFRYGGTTVQAQLPVGSLGGAEYSWLVGRGGGSAAGHGFGEVGLRVLVRGNGDRGSLFFTPTIGGAQLRGPNPEAEFDPEAHYTPNLQVSYGGPMIGFEVEWRL